MNRQGPTPEVSVVVPTFDRCRLLAAVLDGLAAQSLPPERFEVVVVDDGSTDGTADLLARYDGPLALVPLRQANAGPAAARNRGIEQARGRLVVFVDDDLVPAPDLLERHLAAHAGPVAPTAVFGPMLPPTVPLADRRGPRPPVWVRWELHQLARQYERLASGEWEPGPRLFYTGNASVPAESLRTVGGFDPSLRRGEDVELAHRLADAGVRFAFAADAVGHHHAPRRWRPWVAAARAYGELDAELGTRRGRPALLDAVAGELAARNPATRAVARALAGRPGAVAVAVPVLGAVARSAGAVRAERVALAACSAVQNLAYYEGLARGLGGRSAFLALAAGRSSTLVVGRG